MPPSSYDRLAYDGFTAPGVVSISPAALQLGRAFKSAIDRTRPDEHWIVCYDWADSRRLRRPGTNDWDDLGAGIDLAAYERDKVPANAIEVVDGLEFLIKMSSHIWEASRERLIDTDGGTEPKLILR